VHARSTAIMEHRASLRDEEPSRRSTSNLLMPVKATDRSSSIFRAVDPRQPTHAPATERGAPTFPRNASPSPRELNILPVRGYWAGQQRPQRCLASPHLTACAKRTGAVDDSSVTAWSELPRR
jgi:hypothetical protein